jgi:17beta-estradiol 17-dehydrogenase / very-long-chain 3-oxoacyl-CoA reductase
MKINCLPIAVLSRIFIEKMAKRVSRSGIINLSSGASLANFSGCVHYSATKKFDDYLSLTLAEEFREKIDVLTVRPFMVTTPMTRNTDSIMHTPSSKCAKDIVNSLGNRDTCYGSLNHTLQGEVTFELHSSALTAAFSKTMKDFRPIFDKAGQ